MDMSHKLEHSINEYLSVVHNLTEKTVKFLQIYCVHRPFGYYCNDYN